MRKEIKTIVYDENLNVEVYRFEGIVQSFPNHFHDYYVIGLIEKGERQLYCNSKKFFLKPGYCNNFQDKHRPFRLLRYISYKYFHCNLRNYEQAMRSAV